MQIGKHLAALCALSSLCAFTVRGASADDTPASELPNFTLAPGFTAQLVAAEPEIKIPMQLAFDFKGRLLVSGGGESAGRVNVIEIDPATGHAGRVTTFADGLNNCSGILGLPDGSVIVARSPDIFRLTDKNGDGHARREDGEWASILTGFNPFDIRELPNSFSLAPDGWIYALHAYTGVGEVTDKLGLTTRVTNGSVLRFKPDGRGLEIVVRGMKNPRGLASDAQGNLFALDSAVPALWQIIRGGSYQGFSQADDPLGVVPPMLSQNPKAASLKDPYRAYGAGLACIGGVGWPDEFRGNLLHGNSITHGINRYKIESDGATRLAREMPDFLSPTDSNFLPVDVELGPDGALYIADAAGRIWRVVPDAAPKRSDTDFTRMKPARLIRELADENPTRRRMAASMLARRIETEGHRPWGGWLSAWSRARRVFLDERAPAVQRSEALWLIAGRDGIDPFFRRALADPEPLIRATVLRIWMNRPRLVPWGFCETCPMAPKIVESPDEMMLKLLDDPSPLVAREAAQTLAEYPTPEVAGALFKRLARAGDGDPMLRYALRLTLRRILREPALTDRAPDWLALAPDEAELIDLLSSTQSQASCALLIDKLESRAIPPKQLEKALLHLLRNGSEEQIARVFIAPFEPDGHALTDLTPVELRAYLAAMPEGRTADLADSMERIAAALARRTP